MLGLLRPRPGSRRVRQCLLPAMLSATPGCAFQPTDSSEVETEEIYASFTVVSYITGGTIHAMADFQDGDELGTYLALSAGDTVTVETADGEHLPLEESTPDTGVDFLDNYVGYSTEVPGESEDRYVFSFTREDGVSAPRTEVTLPSAFDLVDLRGTSVSRAEPLELTWSPSGSDDAIEIEFVGSCFESVRITDLPDDGDYRLTGGSLVAEDDTATCDVLIEVVKVRPGRLDPALTSGKAKGRQERMTQAGSVP